MDQLRPDIASHYAKYKSHWDSLPEVIKTNIEAVLKPRSDSTSDQFNLGYALGMNTAYATFVEY